MRNPVRCAAGLLALAAAAVAARADTPTAEEIIRRARDFIGGDAALDAVQSLRFTGTITLPNGKSGPVEILVRKPFQFRQTMTIDAVSQQPPAASAVGDGADAAAEPTTIKVRHTTALDGYLGWQEVENTQDPGQWEMRLLEARKVERLRADTFQNINFFRPLDEVGGRVEVLGEAQVAGVDCVKVAYIHSPRVSFTRYFNRETGQLVLSESELGDTRENGEIRVAGVRFPQQIIAADNNGSTTVSFDQIEVNPELSDDLFHVPKIRSTPGAQRTGRTQGASRGQLRFTPRNPAVTAPAAPGVNPPPAPPGSPPETPAPSPAEPGAPPNPLAP